MYRYLILIAAIAIGGCQQASEEAAPEATVAEEAAVTGDEIAAGDVLSALLAAQPDDVKARYQYRHPQETLEFVGVKPGMTIVEGLPGGGWYSKLLINYLGDDGRLIGHIPMETLFVDKMIGDLKEFPAETRRQLLHIILSHHGEYSFGSPRRPKTPEALLVHMTDNLDSKMAGMLEAIAAQGGDDEAWTPYSRILERHIYRRKAPTNDNDE